MGGLHALVDLLLGQDLGEQTTDIAFARLP